MGDMADDLQAEQLLAADRKAAAQREIERAAKQEADLGHRFAHHPPTGTDVARHQEVRNVTLEAALTIAGLTKPGREQSTAFTKLEEAMFWANAAIAREP